MEEEKDFDNWNIVKKETNKRHSLVGIHERELWWISLGLNIGVEIDGKHESYERPVLVIKKFNRDMVWILPTTSQHRDSKFYQEFSFDQKKYFVALTQIRTVSTKRFLRKAGMVEKEDFKTIVSGFKNFLS